MVKVLLSVSRAGASGAWSPGEVIDVDADEAQRMVAAGQAEFVRKTSAERAVSRSKSEKASK